MSDDTRLQRIEETIDKIHQTVVSIENVHGAKLEAVADGLGVANERLERLETGQKAIKEDAREIKRTMGLAPFDRQRPRVPTSADGKQPAGPPIGSPLSVAR